MSRIKWVEEEDAEGKVKAVYGQLKSVFGGVPGVIKVLSPWPELLELYATRIGMIMFSETRLSRAVKEMIASLVSRINECGYCLTYHKGFLVETGISSAEAEAIVADYKTASITDAEKKLLAYVEKVTRNAYKVTDSDVEGLKECGWSEEQILEATLVVGLFSDINRWVDALGVRIEND
ncbi:MAG: peroxidase-related enzyme [Nitrospinae bacterium]|nr:peroxidase-related enzyme [Nitrospinota bacterium]